jgi:hypothetical protein
MKKAILFLFILTTQITKAQTQEWQSPCYEDEQPVLSDDEPLYIKKFPEKIPVTIEIKKIEYGSTSIDCNFKFTGKIDYETGLFHLNDTLGVKFSFAKTKIHGKNKYLYDMVVYKKEQGCWRGLTTYHNYHEVYAQTIRLNGSSISTNNNKMYFSFADAYFRFD